MIVIGGKYKSKRLVAPVGMDTRPTLNRIKENLFNVLAHRFDVQFDQAQVLDLYAGSGALGIEAHSRGAPFITFVDDNKNAIQAIHQNTQGFDAGAINIVQDNVLTYLKKPAQQYDVVFMDPPYYKDLVRPTLELLYARKWLRPDALVVVETPKGEGFEAPEHLEIHTSKTYGKTAVWFLKAREA